MAEIKETGWTALYRLFKANKERRFLITFENGDSFEVKYDMDFEDDDKSTDSDSLEETSFNSVAVTIEKVVVSKTKRYKKGNIIILNPLNMPVSYQIKD